MKLYCVYFIGLYEGRLQVKVIYSISESDNKTIWLKRSPFFKKESSITQKIKVRC